MSSVPMNNEALSLRLSEVLDDIGINHKVVMKRRTSTLIRETVGNCDISARESGSKSFIFGSQSEGSTTIGLSSDQDLLACLTTHHVIHDWADWKRGVTNLLMERDELTAPGYCMLQLLKNDEPLAATLVPPRGAYYKDARGRVLLKNTIFRNDMERAGFVQHGPAGMPQDGPNVGETDYVVAFKCKSWPREASHWINRRSIGSWPTAQLKLDSENSGCFIVPVWSKISRGLEEVEWRISTHLAERYLVFNFNTVQMKCYVLMKMLFKSHEAFQDVISSYMCKNALFHCIESTNSIVWQDQNMLLCLNQTLKVLYDFVYNENCPHFIIPENNLMAGRISREQRHNLLEVIQHIISSNGRVLFDIRLDNVGERLNMKMNRIQVFPGPILSPVEIRQFLSGQYCYDSSCSITEIHRSNITKVNTHRIQDALQTLLHYQDGLYQHNLHTNFIEHAAINNLLTLSCSTIGSLIASYNTAMNIPISDIALEYLKLGVNSDVSSGWLKLATVYYSMGDMNVTEAILRHVEQRYDRNVVMPVCVCHSDVALTNKQVFQHTADRTQITDCKNIVAFCVCFVQPEFHIVPQELRQEFTRSTPEDIQGRDREDDAWMDLAVVDSLPYLYFLLSKTYGRIGNRGEQLKALHQMQQVIFDERNLGHKETALNLLGQCMEQVHLPNDAFHCFERSLQIRPRNNAANFHMSRLFDN